MVVSQGAFCSVVTRSRVQQLACWRILEGFTDYRVTCDPVICKGSWLPVSAMYSLSQDKGSSLLLTHIVRWRPLASRTRHVGNVCRGCGGAHRPFLTAAVST